ncbi:MAG TPA: DUF3857 domain-containing protein, partial [Ferruginibacter sp.]|nr:DUF3857 domain-containing protein [Ferruginibacter sp.]
MKILPGFVVCCLFISPLFAQDQSTVKFGKVSASEFNTENYRVDTSAHAIVVADIGYSEIVANSKGSFSLQYKRMRRVHILDKVGYDAANVEIMLYTTDEDEEKIQNLKAYTYNLENGKVVETKFDKENLFKDKISKNLIAKKFTFPNIKEGSIIEYEYRIMSDFVFNLQPWEFQGKYPTLWSEYKVSLPQFYYYMTFTRGYQLFNIQTQKDRTGNFLIKDNSTSGGGDFNSTIADVRWVMKDVPALREESYTSTVKNHIARIDFQLSELREPFYPKNIIADWSQATASLLKEERFGESLNKPNDWMSEENRAVVKGASTNLDKAKNIFSYIRDNITCTDHSELYCDNSLKTVFQNKRGNVAEVNLLLTAMLLKNNITA